MSAYAAILPDTSLSRSFATSVAFSVLVGYASTHPEKVSTKTNKNLKFSMVLGICVKSICQFLNRNIPLYCTFFPVGACSVLVLFLVHI